MKMNEKKNSWAGGVTIIELVMVITIVAALVGVSSMYIKETIDLWRFLTFRSEVVAQGRLALMRMVREIRQIQDDVSSDSLYIYVANASQIEFNNKDKSDNDVRINYNLSGNNLMRNSDILVNNVTALNFTYFDGSNAQLATPVAEVSQIWRITITLVIQSGSQSNTLRSQVYPRNL